VTDKRRSHDKPVTQALQNDDSGGELRESQTSVTRQTKFAKVTKVTPTHTRSRRLQKSFEEPHRRVSRAARAGQLQIPRGQPNAA
jgi:hypothetical protein